MRVEPVREAPDAIRGMRGVGERAAFLAFVQDDASEAAIRGGLPGWTTGNVLRRGGIAAALKCLESEATPRVLLVDIEGTETPVAELERLAGVCMPDVRVLVLGTRSDIGFYRQMTRDLGVAEYAHKPLTRDAAERLFGSVLDGNEMDVAMARRGGQVVALCGARGGVGTTTLAVHLALHLAEVSRGHVALLDLHLRGGTTGLMLGHQPPPGLRLALEHPERVDSLFLERCAVPVSERLKLIAAEEALESAPAPTPAGVEGVLSLLRERFNHVVVDLPMPPGLAERAVIAASRLNLVVMGPDVASIRDTVAARALLGGGSARMMTVLNRDGLPGALKRKHVVEGLGAEPDVVLPDLPKLLPRAANLGRPADSPQLRRAIAPLTEELAAVRPDAKPGLLARLLRGRS